MNIAQQVMDHRFAGACPDAMNGWDARDPDCEACAALDTLAEQGEVEWEYGVRATGDREPFTDHYDSLDAMSEEFDGRVVWNADEEIVRRRKASPWVPVNENGSETA